MIKAKPQRRPSMTPREMVPAGSVEWCYQTLDLLKIRFERKSLTEQQWLETLTELERHEAWKNIPPERPYGSEDEMLRAVLGVTREQGTKELRSHGGDRRSEEAKNQGDIITLKRGTSPDYIAARLARDGKTDPQRAELAERVARGEISANRAAIEAGYRERTVTIPIHPVRAAHILRRHFQGERLERLLEALTQPE